MPGEPRTHRLRTTLGYVGIVAAAILLFLWFRSLGTDLQAPPRAPDAEPFGRSIGSVKADTLLHVLLALGAVIVAARLVGMVFRRIGQPPVIGEVIAGVLLGPSFLGQIAPDAAAFILPSGVAPFLSVIAQVGVILYMFLVGLELDLSQLRRSPHAALAISHASIVVPFLLGSGFALWLYPRSGTSDVPFTVFALFMGISLSVTAFPVLARILTDRQLQQTRIGALALACAAVDDVTAWCLLAIIVGIAESQVGSGAATLGWTLLYVGIVFTAIRPLVARIAWRGEEGEEIDVTQGWMAFAFVLLLLSAFTTELIGIHAIFGAFVIGAVIPHDSAIARVLTRRLRDLVVVLLLPAFFAFTGMRTQIGLVSGAEQWLLCGVLILLACAGKFGGSLFAGRLVGLGWRDASAVGILMNTRGLMELIVLNIGLDLRVISPTLFAMLVLMAIVTTMATTPVLDLINRAEKPIAGRGTSPA